MNALRQKAEHARKKKMASALLAAKEIKERKAAELNTLRQKAENVRKKRLERTEKEQQQDNRVKVAGYTSHDETSHTRRKKSPTNQRGYQSNEELLTPDRIRNSDTLNWRGASSPSIDKGVVAYGKGLATWGEPGESKPSTAIPTSSAPTSSAPTSKRNYKTLKNYYNSDGSVNTDNSAVNRTSNIDWRAKRSDGSQMNENNNLSDLSLLSLNRTAKADVRRYKTTLCTHWLKSGTCGHGSNCLFAHGEQELMPDYVTKKKRMPPVSHWNNYSPGRPGDRPGIRGRGSGNRSGGGGYSSSGLGYSSGGSGSESDGASYQLHSNYISDAYLPQSHKRQPPLVPRSEPHRVPRSVPHSVPPGFGDMGPSPHLRGRSSDTYPPRYPSSPPLGPSSLNSMSHLSPDQKKSIWLPPQPNPPFSMPPTKQNTMSPIGTPPSNSNTSNPFGTPPRKQNSQEAPDTPRTQVKVLENEVKLLRRALYLQSKSDDTKKNDDGKAPPSPQGIKGHPTVDYEKGVISLAFLRNICLVLLLAATCWYVVDGNQMIRQFFSLKQNSNMALPVSDSTSSLSAVVSSTVDVSTIASSSTSSTTPPSVMAAARASTDATSSIPPATTAPPTTTAPPATTVPPSTTTAATPPPSPVTTIPTNDDTLHKDDVVWVLTEARGWRLGHIQHYNVREHVAVHLLTTDTAQRTPQGMLHVREDDQLRRIHPKLLLDRQHIASYTKVVQVLVAHANGAKEISKELASDACLTLGDLARSTQHRTKLLKVADIVLAIVNTLQSFKTDRLVQHSCTLALGNLAQADADTIKQFKVAETKSSIASAMETLPQSADVVSASCSAIGNIAAAEHVFPGYAETKLKVSIKTVRLALQSMLDHQKTAKVQISCAFAIGAICRTSASLQRIATNIVGVDTILAAMKYHQDNPVAQWRFAFAIANVLSLNPIGRKTFGPKSVLLVLNSMTLYKENKKLQLWSCRALYQLVMGNQKNRDAALGNQGIAVLLETQKRWEHAKKKDVYKASEKVINLLWEF